MHTPGDRRSGDRALVWGRDVDFRVNGYLPLGRKVNEAEGSARADIVGGTIQIQSSIERAYHGGDAVNPLSATGTKLSRNTVSASGGGSSAVSASSVNDLRVLNNRLVGVGNGGVPLTSTTNTTITGNTP